MMRYLVPLATCFALALGAAVPPAAAQTQASLPPPIADYWRNPNYSEPRYSPDGRFLAVATGNSGRMNLAVIELATMKATPLTSFKEIDVVDYRWVGNERLVFSLGTRNSPTGSENSDSGGLIMISRDGKDSRVLARTLRDQINSGARVIRSMEYVRSVPKSDEEILVAANERSADSVDLYRLNVATGRKELLTTETPGRVIRWILDRDLKPRAAVSLHESRREFTVWVQQPDGRYGQAWRYGSPDLPTMVPLGFDVNPNLMFVASDEGRDTMAIYDYDIAKRQRGELIAQHPRFDMGADHNGELVPGIDFDSASGEIRGFAVQGDKRQDIWIDPVYKRLQLAVDTTLPGRVNRINRLASAGKVLISSFSDRHPVRWYVLDEKALKLEELLVSRPWLTEDKMVPLEPVVIKTRDGVSIPGYLMRPQNVPAERKLPLVVHIHGGPWARADTWGYGTFGTREGQVLASRGYAVLLANFRATPGFGRKIYYGGRRQFGKVMQEDIEDATDWAVAQGFADPNRICLSGASYGGYASLMGVAKTPDKYRCAIAGLAVTDLEMLMTSAVGDIPRSPVGLSSWKDMVGDPSTDRDALRAVSPAYLAERIKAPVLMYSGGSDIRVPLEQPQKMRRALEAAGRSVDWIVEPEEAHGFGVLEANVRLYERILAFLDRHIGTGAGAVSTK